jgi:hypothetical protein
MKSRRMRWSGECSTDEMILKNTREIWLERGKGRAYIEDLGVDGRVILRRILGKQECEDVN